MLQGSNCLGTGARSEFPRYLAEPSDRWESAGILLQPLNHVKNVKSNEVHRFPASAVFRKSLKNSTESSSQVGGILYILGF